ncbi:putative Alpha/Beta hydrolase protein [Seiridium cardinale]|uniref:Alpha/Beta hydrolase protein n=1 Tax=Seiridium cardinale TaxID=138064 RepID=A0ABR2X8M5_9PEZI
MASLKIQDFDPSIPKSEVERLWRKLKDTRLPENPVVPDAGDDYGPPLPWVRKLYDKWCNDYDWESAQRKISGWRHYTTEIENLRIHFVHEPAKRNKEKAIPLLLVHGWPGSWFEFSRCVDPLSNPDGGEQAFHVVVASIPGFTWSSGPPRDWTLQDTARIFDKLMRGLGYQTYVAQGGDWGHWVMRELGAKYSDTCKAIHTNMCPSLPPVPKDQWNEREQTAQAMTDWWLGKPRYETHMGYAIEMRTRPQTIGIALSDNPVGIMMWVGEKYYELVDPKYRDLEDKDFVDDVLTTLCLYFFTSPSIMTSCLCYTNNVRHEDYVDFNTKPENLIKAPFGFSSFRYDISPVTQRTAATTGNCKWFREYDHGGHFAALESSKELVQDLRECFAELPTPTQQRSSYGSRFTRKMASFHKFPLLPAELQIQIWQDALSEEAQDRIAVFDDIASRILPTPHLLSSLLCVNTQSRSEALRVYRTHIEVVILPDQDQIKEAGYDWVTLPQSVVNELGISRGVIHLNLSSDTFFVAKHSGYLRDIEYILSRSQWTKTLSQRWWGRSGPRSWETAISARLSLGQTARVNRLAFLDYVSFMHSPYCCHDHRQRFFAEFSTRTMTRVFPNITHRQHIFMDIDWWYFRHEILHDLSRRPLARFMQTHGQNACVFTREPKKSTPVYRLPRERCEDNVMPGVEALSPTVEIPSSNYTVHRDHYARACRGEADGEIGKRVARAVERTAMQGSYEGIQSFGLRWGVSIW